MNRSKNSIELPAILNLSVGLSQFQEEPRFNGKNCNRLELESLRNIATYFVNSGYSQFAAVGRENHRGIFSFDQILTNIYHAFIPISLTRLLVRH